ncbi:hypothetical protein V8C35DRAFT_290503 [Trichoderma chlorosporum]
MVDGQPPPAFTLALSTRGNFNGKSRFALTISEAVFVLGTQCFSVLVLQITANEQVLPGASYMERKRARGLVCLASPRLAWFGLVWVGLGLAACCTSTVEHE